MGNVCTVAAVAEVQLRTSNDVRMSHGDEGPDPDLVAKRRNSATFGTLVRAEGLDAEPGVRSPSPAQIHPAPETRSSADGEAAGSRSGPRDSTLTDSSTDLDREARWSKLVEDTASDAGVAELSGSPSPAPSLLSPRRGASGMSNAPGAAALPNEL